jgi:hypothetical protein
MKVHIININYIRGVCAVCSVCGGMCAAVCRVGGRHPPIDGGDEFLGAEEVGVDLVHAWVLSVGPRLRPSGNVAAQDAHAHARPRFPRVRVVPRQQRVPCAHPTFQW